MRQFLRHLTLLCLVMALLPAAVALPATAQTEVIPDDELVIINRDDRITVRDPYTPAGYVPLSWESPQTGFRQVYTGDFNGDGTAEIVGLRGGEAHIFDPYRQPNEADVARVFTAAPGQVWQIAVTGRFFGGVRDGLVLVESLDAGDVRARMIVYVFDPASGWAQNYSQDLGATFQSLAAGDVDGDNGDELTGIRSGPGYNQILIFDPGMNWATMYEGNYGFPWVAIAAGNVESAGDSKDEIVATRTGVVTNLPSYLIFRYLDSTTLQDVAAENFYPSFQWIALADVTGNGDDEVYLLRPGVFNGTPIVALTSRNPTGDPISVIEFNELTGQTRFGSIRAGDIEGDGRDEVIVMADSEYIIYTEPASSTAFQSYVGAYSTSLSFAVGNLDGSGIQQSPQLSVSPTSVSLSVQTGQTATRTVQIANTGSGTLTWTSSVTPGANWLSILPTGGTAPSTATLQINATALAVGSYTGKVRISGQSGVANSPQDITVNLTVTAQPAQLSVTPTQITLSLESGQSATQQVQIANTGSGPLNWTASLVQAASWLSFSPSSGTAPSTLTLTVNAAGVQPGQYTGKVQVAGSAGVLNSPQDVTVNLTVTAPRLSVTPTEIALSVQSGQSATRQVQITNTGAGSLTWTASLVQGAPWLSFSPSGGTAPGVLTVAINAVDVQPGQYTGKVRIAGAAGVQNSPQDVTINLTVTAPPFFAIPTAVTWTYIPPATPGTRTVTVTGAGISWHAGVVPMNSMQRIQAAIDAGLSIAVNNGLLVLGDGGEAVSILDYINVNPSSSTTSPTNVTLSLIPDNVPYGFNQASVVFVPDNIPGPPAVVVRASVLRSQPGASDLFYLPMIVAGP